LHSAAGPRAILAFLPESRQRAIVQQIYSPENAHTRGTQSQLEPPAQHILEEQIAIDHARGFVIAEEVITAGSAGIGVPIRNYRGEVEGAVVVGYWRDALLGPGSPAIELALGAADSISRALGYRGVPS
jgi:DNA-binding IclR family transcriptional regulator